ncbi:MAG: 5-(carboxyamino)imidazole ribonucleotide mutase [Elusimicrobia bacterium]|nr:5-(carboxyamino)imidazole ribonucleotide mutase [Elusimicrobiota bacterium]MDE2509968.1 5-(carboxyamino)imidazole ribonucleotide mutase [Elusimicrobiota bacterium]
MKRAKKPLVGIIMGSGSDWETMKAAAEVLDGYGIAHEAEVVSAHRTPDKLMKYAAAAEARGLKVIIAGAGGAAHLPGMTAAKTCLPVLGVPVASKALKGLDSLLSIAQMPRGIAVGTLAIGEAGAANAGHLAAQILALSDPALARRVRTFRALQTAKVLKGRRPR